MFSLFIFAGNVAALDFNCQWEGYMSCSNDLADDPPTYFKVEITKKGNFFTTLNITPTPGEKCSGVLDGKKIYIINHKPSEAATCKVKGTLIE